MKTIQGKHGVTLIEIVSALGIIAVGIVGILALFPIAIEAGARAGDRTAAAVLGEYVTEQVRLRADQIDSGDTTGQMLDALNWGDYKDRDNRWFTFDADPDGDNDPSTLLPSLDAYGSGEQIMRQYDNPNDLTDQEMYSRYEVTIEFADVDGFDSDQLMQVIATVRWPRAFSEKDRKKQSTMRFVTFIRPTD